MTAGILSGLRVVEGSAFIAAPLGGMTLAQLGADVIRFDPIDGGLDYRRWPLSRDGASLYWAGLNKGKRSIRIDIAKPAGRELATTLVTAPGPEGGLFLTNFPATGWLGYDRLAAARPDLVMVNVQGNPDGSSAVDYTVNCATGLTWGTGPADHEGPINHLFPVWDAVTGVTAALGMLAAERHRTRTGQGQLVKLALSDAAFAMIGNVGHIAEVQINDTVRPRYGNDLYGAFGSDFATRDGRRIMIVAITARQWKSLVEATGLGEKFALVEQLFGVDLKREGDRFTVRDTLDRLVGDWVQQFDLAAVAERLDGTGVCWGPYQTFRQLVEDDPRCSTANPMFALVDQPGIGRYLMPGSPLDFGALTRVPVAAAPLLGQHTEEVLAGVLRLPQHEIGRLHDARIVAGP